MPSADVSLRPIRIGKAPRAARPGRGALLGMALVLMSLGAHAEDDSQSTLPVDALGKQWWQIYGSMPNSIRANLGESPAACGLGQRGSMWFLSTAASGVEPVTRRCTVPKGVKLFLPLVTAVCTPFPGETLAENIQLCRELIDPFNQLTLTIDGKNRRNLVERRAQSQGFPLWFPEDNLFDSPGEDVPAGVYVAVTEGQYALIEGLPLGRHTIHARAVSTTDPNVPSFDYVYELNVVAAKTIVPR